MGRLVLQLNFFYSMLTPCYIMLPIQVKVKVDCGLLKTLSPHFRSLPCLVLPPKEKIFRILPYSYSNLMNNASNNNPVLYQPHLNLLTNPCCLPQAPLAFFIISILPTIQKPLVSIFRAFVVEEDLHIRSIL